MGAFICFGVLNWPETGISQDRRTGGAPDHGELIQHFSLALDPEDFESSEDWETYIQELLDLFPVDLNTAARSDLLLVPGMTQRRADAIISFRSGRLFHSVDELANVPGIGPVAVETLRPWITVRPRRNRRGIRARDMGVQQFFRYQQSFPAAAGYQPSEDEPAHYPGTPARLYHRQTIATAALSANLTQVKLPGEPYQALHGFDFTSAHLSYQGERFVRRAVIGDYSARFGQGLVLWSNASFGKGGPAHAAPYRRSQGIRPYGSSGQIRFFRGAAVEASIPLPPFLSNGGNELSMTVIHSTRHRSAVEVNGDTIRPPTSSPFHRTGTERARRNNVRETVQGGNLSWIHTRHRFGFTWVSYGLSRPVKPHSVSSPFSGRSHRAFGVDGAFLLGSTRLFAEHAWRREWGNDPGPVRHGDLDQIKHGRSAWIAGAMGSYKSGAEWVIAIRKYRPGYWTEYASGFGEGAGVPSNQSGWYAGYRLRPAGGMQVSGFLDRFHFPVPARGQTRPGSGWEAMVQIQYRQRPGLEYQAGLRFKERPTEYETLDDFHRRQRITGKSERFSGRFQLNWQMHPRFFLRSRYDTVFHSSTGGVENRGGAVSKTVRWQQSGKLRFDLGWTLFDTDDFSSRLYQYEFDLSQVMTSRMLYGLGRSSYAVVRWQPFTWILAELKYARIRFFDRPAVGSGHDQTPGPVRSELGMQLRLSY